MATLSVAAYGLLAEGAPALGELGELVRRHPFVQQVDVVWPNARATPVRRAAASRAREEYYSLVGPLTALLDADFLRTFVRSGRMSAFSRSTALDHSNSVALCAGRLTLVVDRPTYEQLGLEGRACSFRRAARRDRYWIEVDARRASFAPGDRAYERVRWCLSRLPTPVDLLARIDVDALGGAPPRFPAALLAMRCAAEPSATRFALVAQPAWPAAGVAMSPDLLVELQEWIGLATCGAAPGMAGGGQRARADATERASDGAGAGEEEEEEEEAAFMALGGGRRTASGAAAHSPGAERCVPAQLECAWRPLCLERWRGGCFGPRCVEGVISRAARAVASGRAPWAAVHAAGFVDVPLGAAPKPKRRKCARSEDKATNAGDEEDAAPRPSTRRVPARRDVAPLGGSESRRSLTVVLRPRDGTTLAWSVECAGTWGAAPSNGKFVG